jgi:hypothetical protein
LASQEQIDKKTTKKETQTTNTTIQVNNIKIKTSQVNETRLYYYIKSENFGNGQRGKTNKRQNQWSKQR